MEELPTNLVVTQESRPLRVVVVVLMLETDVTRGGLEATVPGWEDLVPDQSDSDQ